MHRYEALIERLKAFAAAREWQPFHTPRNLATCVSVEAGELLELYLWTREGPGPHPPGAGPPDPARLREEAADVLISLLQFAEVAGIDLLAAAEDKLDALAQKYPVALSRGSAVKSPAVKSPAVKGPGREASAARPQSTEDER